METNRNHLRKSWDGYLRDLMESAKRIKITPSTAVADGVAKSLEIEDDAPMEQVLRAILRKMKIKTALWQRSEAGDAYQVTFSLESGYCHEKMMTMLREWGIGEREGSSVSVLPCELMHKPIPERGIEGKMEQK